MGKKRDEAASMSSASAEERRRAKRYRACFPVELVPSTGGERLCVTHDLSSTGGMLLTQHGLSVGDPVKVTLYLKEDMAQATIASGRVVRVNRRAVPNSYWLYSAAMTFDEPLDDTEPAARALSEQQHRQGRHRGSR